jgi:hypothetical protein
MLAVIDQIREKTEMPYRRICKAVRLPYSNFIRWRMRRKKDRPVVKQPGPQKIKPPDYSKLEQDIAQLNHGHNRTEGAGALYARHSAIVSRRDLQRMVEMARHDLNTSHRQNLRRIHWKRTNIAWSMDTCEYGRERTGDWMSLNQTQDLASRYKFSPMAGETPCGEEIAGYLEATFRMYGAPMFLKRDNGGNLNHTMVNEILAEHFVLPLNSPAHYPPYNGAIEEAQGELKCGLASKLACKPACPTEHLEAYAAAVEHDLNHRPRPCLNGKTSCQVYFTGRRTFSKWERRDAYAWITELQNDILSCKGIQPQAAWRMAVEAWLNMKGFITVSRNGKVLPTFS